MLLQLHFQDGRLTPPAMKLYLSYRVCLNQYRQSWNWNFCTNELHFQTVFRSLPARLNPPTVSGLVGSIVVLGKRKQDVPLSWKAKSGLKAAPDTWILQLCSVLHSVKKCLAITLPTLAPFSLFNLSITPTQQAKQISFWLKPNVTRWKLKSLILICVYWGIVDVSIPSFCDICKYRLLCKILFNRWGKLSFISEIVWSIIYDPANKPGARRDEYLFWDLCANKAARMCRHPFNWHVVYT